MTHLLKLLPAEVFSLVGLLSFLLLVSAAVAEGDIRADPRAHEPIH